MDTSRERGLRALDLANKAFDAPARERLDDVAADAIRQAREQLAFAEFVTLSESHASVSKIDAWQSTSAPSLTQTLSLTAS